MPELSRRRWAAIVAGVVLAGALLAILVININRGDDTAADRSEQPAASVSEDEASEAVTADDAVTDSIESAEGSDEEASPHKPPAPPRDLEAERTPLATADDVEPSVDDELAEEIYCSIDPISYRQMIYDADSSQVSHRALRDMMVIGDETYQHWHFSAYGRPGFESMLTLIYEVNRQWQMALDALDMDDQAGADDALEAADLAIEEFEAAQAEADVDCT